MEDRREDRYRRLEGTVLVLDPDTGCHLTTAYRNRQRGSRDIRRKLKRSILTRAETRSSASLTHPQDGDVGRTRRERADVDQPVAICHAIAGVVARSQRFFQPGYGITGDEHQRGAAFAAPHHAGAQRALDGESLGNQLSTRG